MTRTTEKRYTRDNAVSTLGDTVGKPKGAQMEEMISFKIQKSAALVLLNLLWRWQQKHLGKKLTIENDAEWHALAAIQGSLEAELSEPLRPDYEELVREARQKLIEKYGKLADDSPAEME